MKRNPTWLLMVAVLMTGSVVAAPPGVPERPAPIILKKPSMIHIAQMAPESSAVPKGSYLNSCRHMAIEHGVLSAECNTGRNDRFIATSLEASRCGGSDIANRYGVLTCTTPVRANWGDNVLPPGSYTETCSAHVEGTRLVGACRTGSTESSGIPLIGHEGVQEASLDFSRCPDGNDIANMHGELVCVAP